MNHNSKHNKCKTGGGFKLSVLLSVGDDLKKTFIIRKVKRAMTIKTLRKQIELLCGIPYHLQRLHYIDDGDLSENCTVGSHDIVPGAELKLRLWLMWEDLVSAIISGTVEQVLSLGVTPDSDYVPPRIAYLSKSSDRQVCLAERAAVALFVASCHGRHDICSRLLESDANVKWRSQSSGRSALHVAAAMGQLNVVNILLQNGSDIKAVDADGKTPIMLSTQFGHKACERQLVQFTWQQRAASNIRRGPPHPLLPHQRFDSALPAKLPDGPEAQVYRPQLVPAGEFGGTGFDSPRRTVVTPGTAQGSRRSMSRLNSATVSSPSQQFAYYNNPSTSDWLALIDEDVGAAGGGGLLNGPGGSGTVSATRDGVGRQDTSLMQSRRFLDQSDGNLIAAVINRKMHEQRELGLGGLPYDLWLANSNRPELFQALKDQGKLTSVILS